MPGADELCEHSERCGADAFDQDHYQHLECVDDFERGDRAFFITKVPHCVAVLFQGPRVAVERHHRSGRQGLAVVLDKLLEPERGDHIQHGIMPVSDSIAISAPIV